MKKSLKFITLLDLLFILMLSLSSTVSGEFLSTSLYYLAFIFPLALGVFYERGVRKAEGYKSFVSVKPPQNSLSALPLIFPSVLLIMGIAFLTNLVMESFGYSQNVSINEPIILAIFIHALIPAVFEELLFRYLPLKLLSPYSLRWAVIYSSLFFALCHANLYQIPYAFAAGFVFALIDIKYKSILPSVALHFINNLCSVLLITLPDISLYVYIAIGALAAISLAIILIRRKAYRDIIFPLSERGSAEFSIAPLALILVSLLIAVLSL